MSDKKLFNDYFKELHAVARQGDAREESFYAALSGMLKKVADATGRNHIHVTTLPKSTDAGNPDFRLWNGRDRIGGYIEAKKPTEERLDLIEESEQLKRYRATFPNLVLTNFFEFRLYRNGERIQTVLAARPFVLTRLLTSPVVEKADDLHLIPFPLVTTVTGIRIRRVLKTVRRWLVNEYHDLRIRYHTLLPKQPYHQLIAVHPDNRVIQLKLC